jgi:hypothetical protein
MLNGKPILSAPTEAELDAIMERLRQKGGNTLQRKQARQGEKDSIYGPETVKHAEDERKEKRRLAKNAYQRAWRARKRATATQHSPKIHLQARGSGRRRPAQTEVGSSEEEDDSETSDGEEEEVAQARFRFKSSEQDGDEQSKQGSDEDDSSDEDGEGDDNDTDDNGESAGPTASPPGGPVETEAVRLGDGRWVLRPRESREVVG